MPRTISLTVVFYRAENGDIVALLEELPGACGQGATIAEAEASLRERRICFSGRMGPTRARFYFGGGVGVVVEHVEDEEGRDSPAPIPLCRTLANVQNALRVNSGRAGLCDLRLP